MKKITKKSVFDKVVTLGTEEMLVLFHAEWATPSRRLKNSLLRYEELPVYLVDVDELPEAAGLLDIRGVPTICWFKDGDLVKKQTGHEREGTTLESLYTNLGQDEEE